MIELALFAAFLFVLVIGALIADDWEAEDAYRRNHRGTGR